MNKILTKKENTPGIGVRFSQFEAALKYEGWSKNGTLSFIGLRAGYFF